MKRDRAVILLPAMIFMLWTGVLFSGNKVRAEELAPVEVTLVQRELTVSEGEMLTIIPLLEQSVGIHSYQWYRDDVEVEGQTKKTLEILSVILEDAGEYKLVVTTTVGSETVQAESETCAVTVLEAQDGFHSEESSGPESDQPGEDAGSHGSAEASGSDESHTQQGGEPEPDEAPDSSKDTDPSEETESREVISTSAAPDLLNQGAGNNGVLVVMLILILGMGAFGVAFFVNKSRSDYLEE